MNCKSNTLSVSLLSASILALAACSTTQNPTKSSGDADVVVEAKPADDRDEHDRDDTKEKDAKKDDTLAEPVVKADPSDPASGRNQGFGPYDSLELVCGAKSERCVMSEPVALARSKTLTRMATFVEQPMDGQTSLALETKEGWFISSVPDGNAFGGGLSHHTPAFTHYYLDKAIADGTGVVLLRSFSQSVFYPGQGSTGSTSFSHVLKLKCGVVDGRVACGEGKPVHSRDCKEDDCKETGVHPVNP